jgi:hypothetical protein
VDYYAYIDHHFSAEIDPETQDFAATSYTNLTEEEYSRIKAAELEYGVTIILEDAEANAGFYKVRIQYFEFLKYVYDMDEVNFLFGSDGSGRDLSSINQYYCWYYCRFNLWIFWRNCRFSYGTPK